MAIHFGILISYMARNLLKRDVKSGVANVKKPKELWGTRHKYKEFPLGVFRNHIHQEKRRQQEELGYFQKRNKKAQKMHENEVNEMKDEWDGLQHQHKVEEITKMCDNWELSRVNHGNCDSDVL